MVVFSETSLGCCFLGGGMTRGNASGFWSLTVLLGGQGFSWEIRCTRDLFEFQVMRCSQGFLHGVSGKLIWSSILICVLISFSLIK